MENITKKTGNYKRFGIFVQMLESAMLNRSDSVCVDILTYEDLVQLRTRSKRSHDDVFSSTSMSKRYLILTYAAEFDRVCYPLPLCPETEPDTAAMQRTILRLRHEVDMLRLGTNQQKQHATNNTPYDVLKFEYNELQAAHETLMHETESRIRSLSEENERLREELSVFRCEETADPKKKSNIIVTLKRRLKATERTLEQERLAHQRAREISEKVEADLRRELSSTTSSITAGRRRRTRSVSTNRSNYARPIGRMRKKKKTTQQVMKKKKKKKTGRRVRSASPCVFKRFDPTAYEEQRRQKIKAIKDRRQRQIKRAMSPVPRRRGRSLTVRTRKVFADSDVDDNDDDNISRARSIGSRRSKNSRRPASSVRSKKKKEEKEISNRNRNRKRSTSRSIRTASRNETGENQNKARTSRSKSRKRGGTSTKENHVESSRRNFSRKAKKKKKKATKPRSVTDHWMNLNGPSVRVTPQRRAQPIDESIAMTSFRTDAADINEIDARLNKLQHFLRAAKKGESISDLPRV